MTLAPFDIFKAETGGTVLWLGSAEILREAETRVEQLAQRSPGDYLILNQITGTKFAIKLDGTETARRTVSGGELR
jgi:hypothetical protein